MMTRLILIASTLIIFNLNQLLSQNDTVFWLTNAPPGKARSMVKPSGMQKYFAIPGKRGNERFALWPSYGITPQDSRYMNHTLTQNTRIFTFNSSDSAMDYTLEKGHAGYVFLYSFGKEGYNNIYFVDSFVRDNQLIISVAKSERISHKCMNGHKGDNILVRVKSYPEKIPFEIIRKRKPNGENLHLLLQSGQKVTYQLILNGKPLDGAWVRFASDKGWQNIKRTNQKGAVMFQIPQDHFSEFNQIKKKHISYYLVAVGFTKDSTGVYQGREFNQVKYLGSYSGEYIPPEILYQSRLWAVWVILFTTFVISIFIYIHRWRRSRIY